MARIKKADATPLTQERLYQILRYDPISGQLWRLKKAGFSLLTPERDNLGYLALQIDRVRYRVHRLVWFYVHGVWPAHTIDHVNGKRDDNRFENLRAASNTENVRHGGLPINNTSGFRGVTRFRKGWKAQIKHNMEHINIGVYPTPEEAHAAYCEVAKALHEGFWSPGAAPSFRRRQN